MEIPINRLHTWPIAKYLYLDNSQNLKSLICKCLANTWVFTIFCKLVFWEQTPSSLEGNFNLTFQCLPLNCFLTIFDVLGWHRRPLHFERCVLRSLHLPEPIRGWLYFKRQSRARVQNLPRSRLDRKHDWCYNISLTELKKCFY